MPSRHSVEPLGAPTVPVDTGTFVAGSTSRFAVGFAVLLNLVIVASFGWTEWIGPQLRTIGWIVLAVIWLVSVMISWRQGEFRRHKRGTIHPLAERSSEKSVQAVEEDEWFRQARDDYLRGNWYEAEETLVRLNRLLCPQFPSNRYVTFFYGVLDPARDSMTYVNAGHNPPFVIRQAGAVESLPTTGAPLGLLEGASYRAETVTLQPGEILLCYSDGATDEQSPAGEFFGSERLVTILRAVRESRPIDIVRKIEEGIDQFNPGEPHVDDITLVVLKRNGS